MTGRLRIEAILRASQRPPVKIVDAGFPKAANDHDSAFLTSFPKAAESKLAS